ncbi:hypothetical protein, conserved [Trypanosoma brucei gambiense DAL972]|uniref:Uncharacterized protein n=1 Tax=Trypanosoma brucei gambiense (strain MHOM/CI/86/DAL972) TaxID=679716 RepID=D0A834_TRYB9|nr:hypothetical protein, conserved [Trypanosoma brucei gambiense DAL972]CBH17835.1 hypothetical protein, conserved [Trypanosoma brucei gambiense DAL972]|eukprot:XP_011780099.1 hypothetical protein, conserved [Trypanosoma brucei gambiense DAL972]
MSDSHHSGYDENSGRGNAQKRPRSESTHGSSNSWQIVSSSRCIACGRLRSLCECRSLRVDPELRRKNLDTLLLNTPYVRCKQLKALDEAGREEERHRRCIAEEWYSKMRIIKRAAHTDKYLLRVTLDEVRGRENLSALERKEWVEGMALSDKYMVLLALVQREREERLKFYASAERATRMLGGWHNTVFHLLGLQSREVAFRRTLVNNEAAARASLLSIELEALKVMENNEKSRLEFFELFWASRESVADAWMQGVEALECAMAETVQNLEKCFQERTRCFEIVLKRRDELLLEEENARQRLHSLFEEENDFLEENMRFFQQRRAAVMQQEASARGVICQEATDAYSALFLECRRDREKACEAESFKRRRREEEFHAAVASLQDIMKEEEAALALLKTQEHHERELRYQWMLEREKAIISAENTFLQHVQLLFSEEEKARGAIVHLMQQQEAETASWLRHKERKLREIIETALEEKSQMLLLEHEERFSLVSQKAEHEDAVRRWVDHKESARQSLATAETTHRNRWVDMERNAREELSWRFGEGLETCYSQVQQRMEALTKLQQRAFHAKEGIVKQEEEALRLLLGTLRDDEERSLREEIHRRVVDILNTETEHRSHLTQQEVGNRESITTMFLMQERFFKKEAQELLKAQLYEIVAAEESHRRVLLQDADDSVERLYHSYKKLLEEARRREEERVREERRQREVALLEDPRLYREEEDCDLCVDGASPPTGLDDGCYNDMKMGPLGETWMLQRQHVVEDLGGESADVVLLTPETTAFLFSIVNAITEREAILAAERTKAESTMNNIQKKIERQKSVFANVKEQLEESQEKLKRDAENHSKRLATQREAQQKLEAQLARERTRLKEKTEELQRTKNSVSEMRDSIHSQYKKR